MKKTLKSLAAIALIALSSAACQKEQLFDSQTAGEETVTFTVQTDLAATKAVADNDGLGGTIDKCLVAVYMKTGENSYKLYDTPEATGSGRNYNFTVNLLRKQTYQIVVWAHKDGAYTVDYTDTPDQISVSRIGDACNSDAYDAFYASEPFTQGTTTSTTIEAKRPFAQLNLITKDLRRDFEPKDIELTYTADTKFNPFDGTTSGPQEITYTAAAHHYSTLTPAGENTVAMNYLLVGNEQVVLNAVKLKVTFTDDVDITVANVPVKRNYRTNIKGNLFTEQTDFNITVDPIWGDPDSEVGNITTGLRKVNGVYEVSAAEGLSYASANIFAQSGGQFVLTEDIDMTGYTSSYALTRAASGTYTSARLDVQADILVIDGNGHKITKLPGMLIAYTGNLTKLEIKNLTLVNPAVEYDLADSGDKGVGAFVGYAGTSDEITIENCHIQGGYVRGGHWTGGFVGYAAGYNNANDGPVFETLSITNCSIKDAEVSGKGSVGGIIGHATGDYATLTKIEAPTVLRNTIKSTGSSNIKAGSVVATVGCAGPQAWNGINGGTYLTNCVVADNTVSSNGVLNIKFWGRRGENTAKLFVDNVEVTDFDNPLPAYVGYMGEELPAAPVINGDVMTVNVKNAQYALDGAYGSIDGKTINFSAGTYPQLVFGRPNKYPGSNSIYRHGNFENAPMTYEEFVAYKSQSGWTEGCKYERIISNVTFTAESGAVLTGMSYNAGDHIYGSAESPVYDYVLDKGTTTVGSCYYHKLVASNITYEGITFQKVDSYRPLDISSSSAISVIDGVTVSGCNFIGTGTASTVGQAIRFYTETQSGAAGTEGKVVRNLVVKNTTINNFYQGIYTNGAYGVTVEGCTISNTGHNAIALQSISSVVNLGEVKILSNNFENIGDRIIRLGNVAAGSSFTITGNVATNSGDSSGEVLKAGTLAAGVTYDIHDNNWGGGHVYNEEFADR